MKNALALVLLLDIFTVFGQFIQTSDNWRQGRSFFEEELILQFKLDTGEKIVVENPLNEYGLRQIEIVLYQNEDDDEISNSLNKTIILKKKYMSKTSELIRPKINILSSQYFILSWIQKSNINSTLNLQILDKKLDEISPQFILGKIHKEVSWNHLIAFYSIQLISQNLIFILLKGESQEIFWKGFIYNIENQSRSNEFMLQNSDNIKFVVNSINTIIILQEMPFGRFHGPYLLITKINLSGHVLMIKNMKDDFFKVIGLFQIKNHPQIKILSNNKFVIANHFSSKIYHYFVFDEYFNSLLFELQVVTDIIDQQTNNFFPHYKWKTENKIFNYSQSIREFQIPKRFHNIFDYVFWQIDELNNFYRLFYFNYLYTLYVKYGFNFNESYNSRKCKLVMVYQNKTQLWQDQNKNKTNEVILMFGKSQRSLIKRRRQAIDE